MPQNKAKAILTFFVVAAVIISSGHVFPMETATPELISILLLFPIYLWQRSYSENEKLSTEVNGRNKASMLSWIFMLFILALSVRIPSVQLFGMPYEKTPLIYLTILTIVALEKTDVSAFGFKTQDLGKSLLQGFVFYIVLFGTMLTTFYLLICAFTNQPPVTSYFVTPFLLAMPFQTLCVGISEEGLFRGYMQTHFEKLYTSKRAIFLQAVFFGVWHFVWNLFPFDLFGMAQYVITTFLVGLLFGYFFSKVRSLVPLVFAHGLWNSVQQGIFTGEATSKALQTIPVAYQIVMWLLPYAIAIIATYFSVKYVMKQL